MGNTLALPAPKLTDEVYCMDALDFLRCLPEASVDMILADLPYGTTNCAWDTVIPFEPMWAAFKRVIKSRGAIVLTASQPFTSRLVMSNITMFRYEWIVNKGKASNFLDVKRKPLKVHESILVFSQSTCVYYPQISRVGRHKNGAKNNLSSVYGRFNLLGVRENNFYYPKSIIDFAWSTQNQQHPTQKPVALFEYLIRTYTRPGELVIDPTCGSGTTAIAARNTGRHWIVNDYDPHWCDVTRERLAQPYTLALPLVDDAPAPVQAALWEA